jgi:hypothetical protein
MLACDTSVTGQQTHGMTPAPFGADQPMKGTVKDLTPGGILMVFPDCVHVICLTEFHRP